MTAFECLFFGRRPFADKCKDVDILRNSIAQDKLVFPHSPYVSHEGLSAIAAVRIAAALLYFSSLMTLLAFI